MITLLNECIGRFLRYIRIYVFKIAKLQNIIFYFQELLDFFLVIRFSY